MSEHNQPVYNRRRFFGRIGTLLGAAGAIVLARPQSQAPADNTAEQDAPAARQGYRVTEHIRKYYRKARF